MEVVAEFNPKIMEYNDKIIHLKENITKLSSSLNVKNFDKVGNIVEKVFNKIQDKIGADLGAREAIKFLEKLKDVCTQLKRLEEILIKHINSQVETQGISAPVQEVQAQAVETPELENQTIQPTQIVEDAMVKKLTPES